MTMVTDTKKRSRPGTRGAIILHNDRLARPIGDGLVTRNRR
jgi:hypothetical protein